MTQEELLDRLAIMTDRIAEQATERPVKNAMVVFGPSETPEQIRTWEAEVNLWISDGWQPYGYAWENGGTIKLVMVRR